MSPLWRRGSAALRSIRSRSPSPTASTKVAGGVVVRFPLCLSRARRSEVLVADAMAPCQDGEVGSYHDRKASHYNAFQGSDGVLGRHRRLLPSSHRPT